MTRPERKNLSLRRSVYKFQAYRGVLYRRDFLQDQEDLLEVQHTHGDNGVSNSGEEN